MDFLIALLGSNDFLTGLCVGFAATLLLVALVFAFMAWYDCQFPLDAAPTHSAPIAAALRRAGPGPDASPTYAWPRRPGRDL